MKILKILFLLLVAPLAAYDARPPCYKQLEQDFFQFKIVGEALALWGVKQGQWDPIFRALQKRAHEAEAIMRRKASRLTPNPFEKPFQSDVARDLLHETMSQIFERVILESGFFDTVSIGKMFDYIWTHDPRIHTCLPTTK